MPNGPQLFNILTNKPPGRPRWPYSVNWDSPQAQGLVAWFPLGAGAGAQDLVRASGPPTVNGAPVQVETLLGAATKFDGANDYISAGQVNSLDITGEALTLTCWAEIASVAQTAALMGKDNATLSTQYVLLLNTGAQDDHEFRISTNNGNSVVTWGESDISVDTPHLFAGRYDGAELRVFLDGIKGSNSVAHTGAITTRAVDFEIASRNGGALKFAGGMRDVRVYDISVLDSVMAQMHALDSQYDLYWEKSQRTYIFPAHFPPVAVAPAVGKGAGSLGSIGVGW